VALDQSALLEVLVIGAAPNQRTPERLAQRNGHRPRVLATTAGDLELRIPKLRAGSFFPSLLERRRRVDQALFAVVMEAYLLVVTVAVLLPFDVRQAIAFPTAGHVLLAIANATVLVLLVLLLRGWLPGRPFPAQPDRR
jgi:Transposase, Mutator family